ncbi:hypothetical protein L195_g025426 [Trifolium pratense]|uniref:Zinc knuckle CX2CX4HX4C domain-containing protein n=1 Tax=Trifolium pratense TaxID=57577 RepID=A0A2K3NGF5_TRIPR|nr:hypothetical protein L195_g025426 [Trifolium pratense]
MAGNLPDSLWVEREKFAFDIEIEYENPPYFCFTCNSIGHSYDHCRNDLALKIARELDAIKNDPPKKVKQVFVPKTHEDIMQGCSKNVAFEDPLILDIIRSKEIVIERDVLDIEEELSTGISIGSYHLILEQVEEVPTVDLSDIPHQYWEGKDASDIGHNVYTDEEERHAATNFLNNRVATREESFTDV